MFLTADELRELTGRARAQAQCAELSALAIPYKQRSDGTPVVLRAAVEAAFGVEASDEPPRFSIQNGWRRYFAGLDAEPMQGRLRRNDAPEIDGPCVYFHVLDGAVQYVGQTVDYVWRQVAHRKGGRAWDETPAILMPDWWPYEHRRFWLDATESAFIEFLDPPHNIKRPALCERGREIVEHLKETGFRVTTQQGIAA